MRKHIFLFFLLAVSFSLFSITIEELETNFNLSVNLTTINQLDSEQQAQFIDDQKSVLLVGQVSDIIHNVDENFIILELLEGIWLSSTEVKVFKAKLVCSGEKWLDYFPIRRSRNPHPNFTPVNSKVIIIANPLWFETLESGDTLPVLEVISIRIIE